MSLLQHINNMSNIIYDDPYFINPPLSNKSPIKYGSTWEFIYVDLTKTSINFNPSNAAN